MYIGVCAKYPLFLSIFNDEVFRQIFEKSSNIKFRKHLRSGSRVVSVRTDEHTDKHGETNSRFSQFCQRTLKSALLFNTIYFNKNQEKGRVCYFIIMNGRIN